MTRVLIYEGMDGHGECLPSYYYYFNKLGYDVDFILKEKVLKENPLWMLSSLEDSKIYSIHQPAHKNEHCIEIKNKVINLFNYDIYFIATLNKLSYRFVQYLNKNGIKKNKIIFQDHLNYQYFLLQTNKDLYLKDNGFTLGMADHNILPQLSPIKNFNNFEHIKLDNDFNKKFNILISGLSHIHFKNFECFVKSVEELNKEGYNIKINVTGIRELGSYILPSSDCINYLGRLNFKNMAQQYLLNDYLFVLFDTKPFMCLEDHKTFLDGRVSGSRNMSIIYKIPLVVQKEFQNAWNLNDNNSISYIGHDYRQILLNLFNIKKEKYNDIINNLYKKEQEEINLSLDNLKNKIETLKNKKEKITIKKKNKYF